MEKEKIKYYIENVIDKRFEKLISERQNWENNAVDKILSVAQGSAPSPHKDILVKLYTNLNDPTLPSMFRKILAKETAWLDKDFFRWTPDGIDLTDIEGTYWITDWQKDNLNNDLSNFHNTIRATLHQIITLNIGAYQYYWLKKPKMQKQFSITQKNGMEILSSMQSSPVPLEYDLQGLKFEFVNILNYYPDIFTETNFENANYLDGYFRFYKTLAEIKQIEKYNTQIDYVFEPLVIYRGLEYLEELNKNDYANYSSAISRLNKHLHYTTDDNGQKFKQNYEIRCCYIKEINIDGEIHNADGRGYRIEYLKQNNNCYPLFVEENLFEFEKKPIKICRRWSDPNVFYNDSEVGMMLNQHNYLIYAKQMQASALVKATNPTLILSTKLLEGFQNAKDKLKKILTEPGGLEFIDLSKIQDQFGETHLKPLTLGTVEENIKNLDLFQRAIDQCRADIAQANTQVTDNMGAGATAQFNKQIAQEQDLLSREFKMRVVRDLIQPALEFGLEMAKIFFSPQNLTTDINSDDKKYLQKTLGKTKKEVLQEENQNIDNVSDEMDWDEVKNLAIEKQTTFPKAFNVGNQSQFITYNPITEKKQTTVFKTLFEKTMCGFKLEIEDQEYSRQQILEEVVQIYGQIIANIPDSPLKFLVSKLAIQKTLQATQDSNYADIMEELNKLYEQQINPPQPSPEEQAQMQAQMQVEMQKGTAEANQKQATADKQTAEANKINQEVGEKAQLYQALML